MKNKIDIVKLVKENILIVIITAAVVIMLIVYFIIFMPLTKEMRTKYSECRACEYQVLQAHNLIAYAGGISKAYGGRVLLSEKEAATGIDDFTNHAKLLGVNFLSIKPKSVIVKEGAPYKILPIEAEVKAKDEQFVNFLGSIDELKKAIVTLDSFEITPDEQDRTGLNAGIVMNIYLSLKDS